MSELTEKTIAEQMRETFFMGFKKIFGYRMTKGEYCAYRGWEAPKGEDPNEIVYLVEHEPDLSSKPNHPDHEGYISMSPAHVFRTAYRKNGELDFSSALNALKKGAKVCRSGWNGKGMFLYLVEGSTDRSEGNQSFYDGVPSCLLETGHKGTVTRLPAIGMRTTTGSNLTGWLASQTDMLAEDWMVLD